MDKINDLNKCVKEMISKNIAYLKGIKYIKDKHTGEINIKIQIQDGGVRYGEIAKIDRIQ